MSQNQQLGAFGTTVTVNTAANTVLFASQIVVGNSTVNNTINATSVSGVPGTNVNAQYTWSNTQTFSNTITFSSTIVGTANNALNLGGTAAASYALSSSLSSYQTTAGLSANVAALTSNNATYAFGKTEGAINANSALTANNASNLGGTAAASYALKADTTYVGTTAVTLNRSSASLALTGITSVDSSVASTPPVFYASGTQIGTLCRFWMNYNASATSTRASFNLSSVGRNATGSYTVNFSTAMTDANYSENGLATANYGTSFVMVNPNSSGGSTGSTPSTSAFTVFLGYPGSGAGYDSLYLLLSVFR